MHYYFIFLIINQFKLFNKFIHIQVYIALNFFNNDPISSIVSRLSLLPAFFDLGFLAGPLLLEYGGLMDMYGSEKLNEEGKGDGDGDRRLDGPEYTTSGPYGVQHTLVSVHSVEGDGGKE